VNTTAPPKRGTPGLSWRSLSSPSFEKWLPGICGGYLVGWTYAPIAFWIAAIFAFVGLFGGALGGATSELAQTFHIGEGVGFGAAVIGLFVGAFSGLVFIYVEFYHNIFNIIGGIISGLAVSLFTLWLIVHYEHQLLRLRGYRELSRREKQLIDPIVAEILERMGIVGNTPIFYVSDSKEPAAWTYASSIVLAQGLLGSYDDSENPPVPDMPPHAFAAVIAHEISHWARADGVGIRAVWACCWPIVAVYNFACILGRNPDRKFTTLGWILFWPAWVSINLVVIPMLTNAMRQAEYEADARTASLGDEYRAGLRTALLEFQDWEAPRTGWEDVLHATHPPIELRQQQLEAGASTPFHETEAQMSSFVELNSSTFGRLKVLDPALIDVGQSLLLAHDEGNQELVKMREELFNIVALNWLRKVEAALLRGEAVDVDESLENIQARIAGFVANPSMPVTVTGADGKVINGGNDERANSSGPYLDMSSSALGKTLRVVDPTVLEAGNLVVSAHKEGNLEAAKVREGLFHVVLLDWLRKIEAALLRDEAVDVDESLENIQARIAWTEADLANPGSTPFTWSGGEIANDKPAKWWHRKSAG
jgi:Zn-dependent protease with chaperone function